ncbi:MAG: hypothetical protein JWR36_2797 [Glaciihabitans sp.]|jgi:uncharacterized membrane protein|nr:hypothetical protein [Glaciihabitans sp.]
MRLAAQDRTTKWSAPLARLRHDDGSALLLTIFYAALSLAVILLVVASTSLYLERKRLFTVADGAALAGAEAFALDDVHQTPAGFRPLLRSQDVSASVEQYLRDNPADGFSALHVDRAVTVDGRSATVELSAYWSPPVVSLFVPNGFRITVTAVARSVFS